MQRIQILLQKIHELAQKKEHPVVEVDLMLDYTRVLYADLLELRNNLTTAGLHLPQEPVKKEAPAPRPAKPVAATPNEGMQSLPQTAPKITQKEMPFSTQAPQKDVRNVIGINDKYQFISELFGNNKEAYDVVLDKINSLPSFDRAKQWLGSNVHEVNNWEDDHETVLSFYATIHLFYNSK